MLKRHPARLAAALLATLVLTTACGDDGPTYPKTFDPAALQSELESADLAMSAPAVQAFASMSSEIDFALGGGGAPVVVDAPALLLENSITPSAQVRARLRAQAELRTANALPPATLGKTFQWSTASSQYVAGSLAGAPANGVRFVLYTINPLTGYPAVPLVESGYVDLTRTSSSSSVTARVEVYASGLSALKVLDYTVTLAGTQDAPSINVAGFARHGQDELTFSLKTSLGGETLIIDWRTELANQGLSTRLDQRITEDAFTIDAAVISRSGRVDIDGRITELTGGSLAVNVNGKRFATMRMSDSDSEPTFVNADGDPLTAEEESTLMQIFEWFGNALFLALTLLSPVGTLLDVAL